MENDCSATIYQAIKITEGSWGGRTRENLGLHRGQPKDIENYYKYLREKDHTSSGDWYDIEVTEIRPTYIKPDLHKEMFKLERERLEKELAKLAERESYL